LIIEKIKRKNGAINRVSNCGLDVRIHNDNSFIFFRNFNFNTWPILILQVIQKKGNRVNLGALVLMTFANVSQGKFHVEIAPPLFPFLLYHN